MKTTNLFIDFLIIGFLAVFACTPLLVAKCTNPLTTYNVISECRVFLLPIGTIALYILGMLFNQISGYIVKMFGAIKLLPSSRALQDKAFSKLKTDYHNAIQLVVTKSTDAYAYLSYRRTIIRIYRALLTSMLIVSLFLLVYHGLDRFYPLTIMSIAMTIFAGVVFTKNLKGYYIAIAIFYRQLS